MNKLICKHVPEELLKKEAARYHFGQFGSVKRIVIKSAAKSISVEYSNKEAMDRAYKYANWFDNQAFSITEEPTDSTEKPMSRRKKFKDEPLELTAEVRAELDAMGGGPSLVLLSGNKRKNEPIKIESKKALKRRVPVDRENITPKKNKPIKIDESNEYKELLEITKQRVMTIEDKFKVLDARDKLLRMIQKENDARKGFTIGTCPDMCPEKERLLRVIQHQVSYYEQNSAKEMDPQLAVKQYSRSSADQESPLPHELRPVQVLEATMTYLIHKIMPMGEESQVNIGEWFHFLWDRTRSIRKDITQQALCCQGSVRLLEQCARFHIHCSARLVDEDPSVFDQKINTENLTKCLQTLKYMYNDLRLKREKCPNEAEFRGYIILLNLNDGNFMWEVQRLPLEIQQSKEIKEAISIYWALNSDNFVRFFKLVRNTTYLNACILMRYFMQIRIRSLEVILKCYTPRITKVLYPIDSLTKNFGFESVNHTIEFMQNCGLEMNDSKTALVFDKSSSVLHDMNCNTLERSINLVESKKGHLTLGMVVNGGFLPNTCVLEPQSSFDEKGFLKEMILQEMDYDKPVQDEENNEIQDLISEPDETIEYVDESIEPQELFDQEKNDEEMNETDSLDEVSPDERIIKNTTVVEEKLLTPSEESLRSKLKSLFPVPPEPICHQPGFFRDLYILPAKLEHLASENDVYCSSRQPISNAYNETESDPPIDKVETQVSVNKTEEKSMEPEITPPDEQIQENNDELVNSAVESLLSEIVENVVMTERKAKADELVRSRRCFNIWREYVMKKRKVQVANALTQLFSVRDLGQVVNMFSILNSLTKFSTTGFNVDINPEIWKEKTIDLSPYAKTLATKLAPFKKQNTIGITDIIYWKCLISIPDRYEDSSNFCVINSTLESYFNWKSALSPLIKQEFGNDIPVRFSFQKEIGKGSEGTDANGLIFIDTTMNQSLFERILQKLRHDGIHRCIPIVIILQDKANPSNKFSNLQMLLNMGIISAYAILYDYVGRGLIKLIDKALQFLAESVGPPPPIEIDYLENVLFGKFLNSEIWETVSCYGKSYPDYGQCITNPNTLFKLYNDGLKKLKKILLDDSCYEYSRFPGEFKEFEDTAHVPCDYKYLPLLQEDFQYKKFIHMLFDEVMALTIFSHWPPNNFNHLVSLVDEFCNSNFKPGYFTKMERCIIRDRLFAKFFHYYNAGLHKVIDKFWIDNMKLIIAEKYKQCTKFLTQNQMPRQWKIYGNLIVVYNKEKLNEFLRSDWFYLNNPIIANALKTIHISSSPIEEVVEHTSSSDVDEVLSKARRSLIDIANRKRQIDLDMDLFNLDLADLEGSLNISKRINSTFKERFKNLSV